MTVRTRWQQGTAAAVLVTAALALSGCGSHPHVNPSFPVTQREADAMLVWMAKHPRRLERPVVVLGGYMDFWVNHRSPYNQLGDVLPEDQSLDVSFRLNNTFGGARERALNAVDAAFPSDDPVWTTEVDVVGYSIGGLIARYAAAPPPEGASNQRRLKIHTLYSIAAPHRGLQWPVPLDPMVGQMQPGSDFLERLDHHFPEADYEMICYVRLGDNVVGEPNAAPPGITPYWVPTRSGRRAHSRAQLDQRFNADIARRVRGEKPLATGPPAPLPEGYR